MATFTIDNPGGYSPAVTNLNLDAWAEGDIVVGDVMEIANATNEWIQVTAVSGTGITVNRGFNSTTASGINDDTVLTRQDRLLVVNSTGSAAASVIVDGVDLGASDDAFTSMALAHTSAYGHDTVVANEAFSDGFDVTFTKNLTVDVADSARCDGTRTVNGYYIDAFVSASSQTLLLRNVYFRNARSNEKCLLVNSTSVMDGSHVTCEGCTFYKPNSYECVSTNGDFGGTASLTLRRCILYPESGASAIVCNAVGSNATIDVQGCTVYGLSGAVNGVWNNTSQITLLTVRNTVVLGSFSGECFNEGSGSFNSNSDWNVASDLTGTDAGSNSANSVTAASYFLVTTLNSEDAHCVDRDALVLYSGENLSSEYTLDWDGEAVTDWYAGADWIAGTGGGGGANMTRRCGMRVQLKGVRL